MPTSSNDRPRSQRYQTRCLGPRQTNKRRYTRMMIRFPRHSVAQKWTCLNGGVVASSACDCWLREPQKIGEHRSLFGRTCMEAVRLSLMRASLYLISHAILPILLSPDCPPHVVQKSLSKYLAMISQISSENLPTNLNYF